MENAKDSEVKYGGYAMDGVMVALNLNDWTGESAPAAVYLRTRSDAGGIKPALLSTTEAREIAQALIEAAEAYDNLKPDPQAEFTTKLQGLGEAAVIRLTNGGKRIYHRRADGMWARDDAAKAYKTAAFRHEYTEILFEGVE